MSGPGSYRRARRRIAKSVSDVRAVSGHLAGKLHHPEMLVEFLGGMLQCDLRGCRPGATAT